MVKNVLDAKQWGFVIGVVIIVGLVAGIVGSGVGSNLNNGLTANVIKDSQAGAGKANAGNVLLEDTSTNTAWMMSHRGSLANDAGDLAVYYKDSNGVWTSGPLLTVDKDRNIMADGKLDVLGDTEIDKNLYVGGDLTVSGEIIQGNTNPTYFSTSNSVVQLHTPIKSGNAVINVLYGDGTTFRGLGYSATQRLAVGDKAVVYNGTTDDYFVASWISGNVGETYLLKAKFPSIGGVNIIDAVSGIQYCTSKKPGETCVIGSVVLTIGAIDPLGKTTLTAGSDVSFNRIFVNKDLTIKLPYLADVSGKKVVRTGISPNGGIVFYWLADGRPAIIKDPLYL